MEKEIISAAVNVNPLSDFAFDVTDPNGWHRYVADSLVLAGLARRSGETYAREIRILVKRFGRLMNAIR